LSYFYSTTLHITGKNHFGIFIAARSIKTLRGYRKANGGSTPGSIGCSRWDYSPGHFGWLSASAIPLLAYSTGVSMRFS